MSCASKISSIIEATPVGQPFCTRDVLKCGSRTAVDKTLSRFVNDNIICRLANGVFMRMNTDTPLPSIWEIAKIKSAAFGKEIVEYGGTLAHKFGLVTEAPAKPAFYTNGNSTSFRYLSLGIRIRLKSASKKRMQLKETPQGKIVRALWHMGDQDSFDKLIEKALAQFPIPEMREILALSKAWMPAWLAAYFPTPHLFTIPDALTRDIYYDSNFAPASSA